MAVLLTALFTMAGVSRTSAQSADDLMRQGVDAYRSLEYAAATALLRRALAVQGERALADSARAEAGIYLGASELFRGENALARNAFRLALMADPRRRPDPLIFPPEVANAFEAVRQASAYVRMIAPADTTIRLHTDRYPIRLYSSTLHDIDVHVLHEDGWVVSVLYEGPINDSLDVQWDGMDTNDTSPVTGDVTLRVTSRPTQGDPHTLRMPLSVRRLDADTAVLPPPPTDTLMVRGQPRLLPAVAALAAGLVTGAAAAVLPTIVAEDGRGGDRRFIVAGTLGMAGVIGFFARRESGVSTDNAETNQRTRAEWQRAVAAVRAQNAERRRDVRLRIEAGAVMTSERNNR
jgi:hypothetical protein